MCAVGKPALAFDDVPDQDETHPSYRSTNDYHNSHLVGSCHEPLYRQDREPTERVVWAVEGTVQALGAKPRTLVTDYSIPYTDMGPSCFNLRDMDQGFGFCGYWCLSFSDVLGFRVHGPRIKVQSLAKAVCPCIGMLRTPNRSLG